MWNCSVNYSLSVQQLVEEAITHLDELVFDCWKNIPSVKICPYDNEEFILELLYENKNSKNECFEGHEALDLVQSFIEGFLVGKGLNRST